MQDYEGYTSVSKLVLERPEGSKVRARGWLHNRRSSGGIAFLMLRDGSGLIQCTVRRDKIGEEVFEMLQRLPLESTIEIQGEVKVDPRAPQGVEITVSNIVPLFAAEEGFPIAKKYHGPDFLLDNRHLWVRSQKMQAVLRVRSKLVQISRRWLEDHGYMEVHAPIIVTAAVEGGATLFKLKYFDREAYLSQSWQLYAEALIASLGKIYTIAPSFRAEKSKTRRHLTEFWHLEVEEPWLSLDGLLKLEEQFLSDVLKKLAEAVPQELKFLGRDPEDFVQIRTPFPRITYDEAVDILKEKGLPFKWGMDLSWRYEKVLASAFDTPFFVTGFPKGVKAFYHMPDPRRPEVTLSADLLAPEGYGEITGGGQRIHDPALLIQRIKEEGLDVQDYSWYIDLRKYGTVPHSGFGLGVDRTVAWICKLKHVRDATAFPRLINRLYP